MKKNKKWLKERELGRAQQWAWDNCVGRAYELAEQLDKPQTNSQIDKLANFIMSEVEGEPSQSQGAVDTAIRIIKYYQNQETLKITYDNDFEKLLDEVARSYLEDDGPTVNQIYKLSKIMDNPDLILMDVDELENYLLGMWDGIQRYKRELSIIDGDVEVAPEC